MISTLRHKWRQNNHRHTFEFSAFKLPRPEGGTYYQLRCTKPHCFKRNGERQYKPSRITRPSILFTVKIPTDLMPALERRAKQAEVAQQDYIGRIVKRELMKWVPSTRPPAGEVSTSTWMARRNSP